MVPTRKELLKSIATKIADYRKGEIPQPDATHVNHWIEQFPSEVQEPMLAELDYVLDKTYVNKQEVEEFLRRLIHNKKFCGDKPRSFWKNANILNIQQGGNSQRDMLKIFDAILQEEFSLTVDGCKSNDGPYIYLDDGIFGGGRVLQDISSWMKKCPTKCDLRIVVAVLHLGGQYYANKNLNLYGNELGKKVKFGWWRILEVENRKYYKNNSDVLWPTSIIDGPFTQKYIHYLTEEEPKFKLELRTADSIGNNKFFSSPQGRVLLEQQLLLVGLKIREMCSNLPESERPLGHTGLKTLGFGSTVVTYRNCPNNCPLAFWVDEPWYPLFPRKTNRDSETERFENEIIKIRQSRRK